MKREDLRKVEIKTTDGTTLQGYFHQWSMFMNYGIWGDAALKLGAIVELEDGNVIVVATNAIRFID